MSCSNPCNYQLSYDCATASGHCYWIEAALLGANISEVKIDEVSQYPAPSLPADSCTCFVELDESHIPCPFMDHKLPHSMGLSIRNQPGVHAGHGIHSSMIALLHAMQHTVLKLQACSHVTFVAAHGSSGRQCKLSQGLAMVHGSPCARS